MTHTLQYRLLGSLAALALMFAIAPFAFAEENGDTDWETKAGEKIERVAQLIEDAGLLIDELTDEDDITEAEEDLAESVADLTNAETLYADAEYEEAYEEAADAYKEASELIDELTEDATEDNDDEDEYDDDSDNDKKDRCDRPGVGNARYCKNGEAKNVPLAMKCKVDMLRDGERDRKFCRDGEWKEKREAKLADIMSGFIEAADLDEEAEDAIRAEVEALVRQLISLILANRLGS